MKLLGALVILAVASWGIAQVNPHIVVESTGPRVGTLPWQAEATLLVCTLALWAVAWGGCAKFRHAWRSRPEPARRGLAIYGILPNLVSVAALLGFVTIMTARACMSYNGSLRLIYLAVEAVPITWLLCALATLSQRWFPNLARACVMVGIGGSLAWSGGILAAFEVIRCFSPPLEISGKYPVSANR